MKQNYVHCLVNKCIFVVLLYSRIQVIVYLKKKKSNVNGRKLLSWVEVWNISVY